MEASPLAHVEKIETPLLIHATTFDRTVPVQLHTESAAPIDWRRRPGKNFEAEIYDHAPGGHGFSQGDTAAAGTRPTGSLRFWRNTSNREENDCT